MNKHNILPLFVLETTISTSAKAEHKTIVAVQSKSKNIYSTTVFAYKNQDSVIQKTKWKEILYSIYHL